MAKRFTDNEKWKDTWFGDLPSKYKLFWFYILDDCNHAGIWKVNFRVAQFLIGENLEPIEVKRYLKSRIVIIDDEYWFIPKFLKFQYANGLKAHVKAQKSVIDLLTKFNLNETVSKQLGNTYVSVQDKDKDIDKDITTNKVKSKSVKKAAAIPTQNEFLKYAKENDGQYDSKRNGLILKYKSWVENNWKDGFDKPIKNWKSKLLNNLQYIKQDFKKQNDRL